MNKRMRCFALLAAAALAAEPAHAFSLFGLGKKKDQKSEAPESPAGRGLGLPGIEASGGTQSTLPRMAVETAAPGGMPETATEGQTQVGEHASPTGEVPDEIVIRGPGAKKLNVNKPPLAIDVDAFESIRESLVPDQALLLAESPLAVVWRRTHPEHLRAERVIQPWLTTFSERTGVVFRPLGELQEVLQRKLTPKDAKGYQWSLTVADEDGKVFQHWEGSGEPPQELVWPGQNEQGEWLKAGAAYSPVYMFTDPGGTPYTRVGKPLRFKGIVHQERTGVHLSLDSSELFGKNKQGGALEGDGKMLVRAAADLIKRRYSGVPIRVEAYAQTKPLADQQATSVEQTLIQELMLLPQDISVDTLQVPYSDQRLEIVLLNR